MEAETSNLDERARLAALREYGIRGALAERGLDRIVNLAAQLFKAPVALISLVEAERQLFAARVGVDVCETARAVSFCTHAIRQTDVMVVLDATQDARFQDNPLVTGDMHIRFYAGVPLLAPSGHVIGSFCVIDTKPRPLFDDNDRRNLRDLAKLVLHRLELRRLDLAGAGNRARFRAAAAASPDAVIGVDADGMVTLWNPAAQQLLGYAAAEVEGRSIDMITPGRPLGTLFAQARSGNALGSCRVIELDAVKKGGGAAPVELLLSTWRNRGRASYGVIVRDVAERRACEERLYRLAHLDPLTGLASGNKLRSCIEQALAHYNEATLMLIDIDDFKTINDSLGQAAGDAVLIEVAERLSGCVRGGDTVARLSSDKFVILVPGLGDQARAARIADKAIECVTEIRSVGGEPISIGASGGIAMYPGHGATVEELLSGIDLALHQAKAEGRHCRRFYTPGLRQAAVARRAYQGELRRAREQGEFEMFYQPQFRLSDGGLVGAEALIRWRHPRKGLLSPAEFLPTLEDGPLAAPVGEWTIRTACRQAVAWRAAGATDFRVAVNLFSAQFSKGDLARKIRTALAETGLPANALELEITENIILRHDDDMIGQLRELREEGVGLAFDDYGTGYASFSMLKRYPLTRLKIDRSFVHGV